MLVFLCFLLDFVSDVGRNQFCVGDVRDLSYVPSSSFDYAITHGVLFYMPSTHDLCVAVKEMVRITKSGGMVNNHHT